MISIFEIYLYKIIPKSILRRILPLINKYRFFINTKDTQTPISFDLWYEQKVKGINRNVYWPVHPSSTVLFPNNVYCGIETSPGYSPGNYIQAMGKIYLGDYTQIAPNVGIKSSNHDIYDNRNHILGNVRIGKYCWIGMGAVILPGVELGDFTIVGAGSIVTKSFIEGYQIIAGNPARTIKYLQKDKCIQSRSKYEYNGYIPHHAFEEFRAKHLKN